MDGQTYGRTDSPCVLQDFVPFGAAAQKGREKEREKERKKEPVAQTQEMFIGSLALFCLLLYDSSHVSSRIHPYFPPSIGLLLESRSLIQSFGRPGVVSGRQELASRSDPASESIQQNWVT